MRTRQKKYQRYSRRHGAHVGLDSSGDVVGVALELVSEVLSGRLHGVGLQKSYMRISVLHTTSTATTMSTYLERSSNLVGEGFAAGVRHDGTKVVCGGWGWVR